MPCVTVRRGPLCGSVNAIPSKSYAHRILICSAFADAPVLVKGMIYSKDMEATVSCLRALGVGVEDKGCGNFLITPVKHAKNAVLNCNESGSTLRFMLAVAPALGGEFTFVGSGRLKDRPNAPLLNALERGGIDIEGEGLPLTLKGKLSGGVYDIDGGVSSQYVTGLLLAAALVGEDFTVRIDGELKSKGYVDITLDVLSSFGVEVAVDGNCYTVRGGQRLISPGEITVEGDWSNAAFFLAAGLLGGSVAVYGLNENSLQGDMAVIDVMRALGGCIKFEKGAFIAQKSDLFGTDFNVENIIDAAPVLSVLCAFADGESRISGVERLKLKESDRLSAIIEMITALGGKATTDGHVLNIVGKRLSSGTVDGKNDHRMVMSAAIAATVCGDVTVIGAEAVNKSYPDFFKDFKSLGGIVDAD